MKAIKLTDYFCQDCRMPSVPGTCELCRNRVARELPESELGGQTKLIIWIAVVAVLVMLYGHNN